ncbi:dioxygenase family protein [Pseudothauera rhizosphaerae]|nr:hypothetical protein [Pseudothauera rhizosphaerae]
MSGPQLPARPRGHDQTRRRLLGGLAVSALAAAISRAHAGGALCGPTASTTAGPFYVRNAPRLTRINRHGVPGTPMRVSGTVSSGDGAPLAGAQVELWHCDAAGHYHPAGSGDVADYADDEIDLRGIAVTDARGEFRFDSIVPAQYGTRRRHLHWRITAPGHRALVTQSYWVEERGTAIARRDWVDRDTEDCRWLAFTQAADGAAEGRFDVVLQAQT